MNTWRKVIPVVIKDSYKKNFDMYQFGIGIGKSVREYQEIFNKYDITNIYKIWLFDSFEGLEEDDVPSTGKIASSWKNGSFSAKKHFNLTATYAIKNRIRRNIRQNMYEKPKKLLYSKLNFIVGKFENTLNFDIVANLSMIPASIVDIDVNTHKATYEVLDFMFKRTLMSFYTVVVYDNFGATKFWTEGISRAHMEIAKKYKVDFVLLYSTTCIPSGCHKPARQRIGKYCPKNYNGELNVRTIFLVKTIGFDTNVC